MDPLYEVQLNMEKRLFFEYGGIHKKKSKASIVILICSLFMLFILYPFPLWEGELGMIIFSATMGFFFFLYWAFLDRILGMMAYKNMNKKVLGVQTTYLFDEAAMHVQSELESSAVSYTAIENVLESEHIFALYINKASAHIFSKENFTKGTPEAFRDFISEKTGQQVRFVKTRSNMRIAILSSLLVLTGVIAVTFGVKALQNHTNDRPKVFATSSYSIELTDAFIEDTDSSFYFAAETKDVYMLATQVDREQFNDDWGLEIASAGEYAAWLMENLDGIQNAKFEKLNKDTVCLTYTNTADNMEYYYYDMIAYKEGTFWITEFICPEKYQNRYSEKFARWSRSVKINDGALYPSASVGRRRTV